MKLDPHLIHRIKELAAQGVERNAIATRLGLSRQTVWRVLKGYQPCRLEVKHAHL